MSALLAECDEEWMTGKVYINLEARSPASNHMLAEISQAVEPDAHAVVIIDRAGWHVAHELEVPHNITLVPLPPYSPELNAIERLWQFMRASILSHRLFADTDHIIDACCKAWNAVIGTPGRIRTTCGYPWALQVKTS